MTAKAFVTLATNDKYCLGALVLASSLKCVKTRHSVVCMITMEVSKGMRSVLERVFDQIYLVDTLDSRDTSNLYLLERPDLGVTFTKLHCWRLEQYGKCVFLDADTLVLTNCDELFEREEFSAAPDPGWPDCFNSGVFVYTPSKETYSELVEFAISKGSFDGGDQGLLNLYFSDWAYIDISKHLPFLYNVVSQAFYSYLPAFRRFGSQTKICHFIGPVKPWHLRFDSNTGSPINQTGTGFNSEFLNRWWRIFTSTVLPLLQRSEAHGPVADVAPVLSSSLDLLMPQLSGLTIDAPESSALLETYKPRSDIERQGDWERGIIDYTGADSFESIKSHLDKKLSEYSAPPPLTPSQLPQDARPKIPKSAISSTSSGSGSAAGDVHPKTSKSAISSTSSDVSSGSSKPIKGVLKKPKADVVLDKK